MPMENVVVIFRYESAREIEEIARQLSTTKSDIVRLCVHEGIKRIRAGEFKFTVSPDPYPRDQDGKFLKEDES